MKKIKKLMALLSVAVMAVPTVPAVFEAVKPVNASAVDDNNDDWLHAEGSRLYDMNGNEVWLTGANWFGLNCIEYSPHYLYAGDIDDILSEVADRGINVILEQPVHHDDLKLCFKTAQKNKCCFMTGDLYMNMPEIRRFLQICHFMKTNGEKIEIVQGGCYENLENYYIDYKAWFDFLKRENYDDIYVVGHSLACNKIIDYFNKYEIDEVKKIVMLAPQDLSKIIYTQKNNISQAKLYMLNNKENEILSEKFLGFCPISAKTFLSFGRECFLHNLKYKDANYKYQKLKYIKKPIYIFIGENDEGLNGVSADKYMQRIIKNTNNIQYQVMENCNHTFKNYTNVLAEKVIKFILE